MGITWRSTMPLLSTLAALVIIVHSAEDNLDREHRYDLRPRYVDTRPSDNEQPWRIMRAEPVMQETDRVETWNNDSQDEPPVRRRLGLKRKRRPPAPASDEVDTETFRTPSETSPPNPESEETIALETTETSGRRRKRLRPNRWTDEIMDTQRPLRRRGQRRKRPSLDTWPQLSEFSGYSRNKKPLEANRETIVQIGLDQYDIGHPRYAQRGYGNDDEYVSKEIRTEIRPLYGSRFDMDDENVENDKPYAKDDKSLSEFSVEVMGPVEKSNGADDGYDYKELRAKMKEKSPKIFYDMDKSKEKSLFLELDKYFDFKSDYVSFLLHNEERQKNKRLYSLRELIEGVKSQDKMDDSVDLRKMLSENNIQMVDVTSKCKDKVSALQRTLNGTSISLLDEDLKRNLGLIDPLTLKDILKRSNGTSLSEILQQHNLTLADLLNGKENAISVLKSEKNLQKSEKPVFEKNNTLKHKNLLKPEVNKNKEVTTVTLLQNIEEEFITTTSTDRNTNNYNILTTLSPSKLEEGEEQVLETRVTDNVYPEKPSNFNQVNEKVNDLLTTTPKNEQRKSGMLAIRRYPGAIRRKQRMRPMMNNTYKSQLNRDLIALSARRYAHQNRRNTTKAKEWRDMVPLMKNINTTEEKTERDEKSLQTKTAIPDETTTIVNQDEYTESTTLDESITISNVALSENKTSNADIETTTISVEILVTELDVSVTENPIVTRPAVNAAGLRRQSYNNRLNKKRMKHKSSTTEAPQDNVMKNLLGLGSLVSSSEFIAKTQLPRATSSDDYTETVTELEEFLTTRSISKSTTRSTRLPLTKDAAKFSTVTRAPSLSSTEKTAKIEIEEILNDTRSSAKLSKILRERNMTLSELLEHRERGSSHVHLADIFHNASREPNPPEPFLSKSSIEPISKETYPLRVLLDANSHESPAKATTTDPVLSPVNIPVIMDFGNNVNENAENMGIMSLFNNFTKNNAKIDEEKSILQQDSKGTPYTSTIITVNATDNDDTRESRLLTDDQDMISWNEIFSMIRKNQKNETYLLDTLTKEITPTETYEKITLEEDVDGDGLIVLEDLQHLRDLDNNDASSSEEKIEFRTLERMELPSEPGILNKTPNSAKSVTVATASIVGLAMILFLLTYAALKWRQQRSMSHKKTFCDERIPTPVFENRTGKKNCSSRSISPMLPTSNIYTMNTLDSQNGKDSPEYMWDSLRKPFQ